MSLLNQFMRNHTEHKTKSSLLTIYSECTQIASMAAALYMPYCLYTIPYIPYKKGMDEFLAEFKNCHKKHFENKSDDYKQLFTVFFVNIVKFNKDLNDRACQ